MKDRFVGLRISSDLVFAIDKLQRDLEIAIEPVDYREESRYAFVDEDEARQLADFIYEHLDAEEER